MDFGVERKECFSTLAETNTNLHDNRVASSGFLFHLR